MEHERGPSTPLENSQHSAKPCSALLRASHAAWEEN